METLYGKIKNSNGAGKPVFYTSKTNKSSTDLPKPKNIIAKALGIILTAFEDINQMEVIKVKWEEIKKLQVQPTLVI